MTSAPITALAPWQLLIGDAAEQLRTLPSASVQCCVTSQPYWGLRDYGVAGQLGQEETPEEFVSNSVKVYSEVRRVLKDDGTLFLNIGDTYANDPKGSGSIKGKLEGTPNLAMPSKSWRGGDLKKKDLVGIPWMLAFALRADGWYLRCDMIWHKPNGMPTSQKDRPTRNHEYVFLLSKSPRYYYDHEAIKEPAVCGSNGSQFHTGKTGGHQQGRASTKPRINGGSSFGKQRASSSGVQSRTYERPVYETRSARSVWSISTRSYRGAHFAVMPPALAERCILAGSAPGDTVLDPFAGSGTTLAVAVKHGRRAVGIELNPEYAPLIEERMAINDGGRA